MNVPTIAADITNNRSLTHTCLLKLIIVFGAYVPRSGETLGVRAFFEGANFRGITNRPVANQKQQWLNCRTRIGG
jgi:hypothetical protein